MEGYIHRMQRVVNDVYNENRGLRRSDRRYTNQRERGMAAMLKDGRRGGERGREDE